MDPHGAFMGLAYDLHGSYGTFMLSHCAPVVFPWEFQGRMFHDVSVESSWCFSGVSTSLSWTLMVLPWCFHGACMVTS